MDKKSSNSFCTYTDNNMHQSWRETNCLKLMMRHLLMFSQFVKQQKIDSLCFGLSWELSKCDVISLRLIISFIQFASYQLSYVLQPAVKWFFCLKLLKFAEKGITTGDFGSALLMIKDFFSWAMYVKSRLLACHVRYGDLYQHQSIYWIIMTRFKNEDVVLLFWITLPTIELGALSKREYTFLIGNRRFFWFFLECCSILDHCQLPKKNKMILMYVPVYFCILKDV